VRANLAELVTDVAEDRSIGGVLHDDAGLAVKPARLDVDPGGDGVDTTEPAVGEGIVTVEGLALPDDPLQAGLEAWVLAVDIEDGPARGAERATTEGPLAEKGLPATGGRLAEARGRGAGEDRGREDQGGDGSDERLHARL